MYRERLSIESSLSPCRIGMDLSKVSFPTFVLEPRSMLERITDFMSHPELVFRYEGIAVQACEPLLTVATPSADQEEQAEERFIRVLMYYLSGWHVKPPGVKKPYVSYSPLAAGGIEEAYDSYNPVLGEFFRCRYDYNNGTSGYYIAEQGALGHAMWKR